MKQIIPFKQELLFKTKISEITSISLEHTLSLKEEDLISGEFLISGDYKMTEGSINREKFSFNLPFEIALDSRYDVNNLVIDIDNFYYEVVNNEALQVNIDVYFEGNKKEETEPVILDVEPEESEEAKETSVEPKKEPITKEEAPTIERKEKPCSKEKIPADERKEQTILNKEEPKITMDTSQDDISIIDEQNKNIIEKNIDYAKVEKELELTETDINSNNDTAISNVTQNNNLTKNNYASNTTNIANFNSYPNTTNNDIQTTKEDTTNVEAKNNTIINNDFNIFENIDNSDTYVTYHVYIIKEDDNIDTITEKYGVTKEEITNYNDITTLNPGDKIIIPNKNE